MEADGRPSDLKEKLPIKRSKGSLGSLNMITGKNNELVKTSGPSTNGVYSKRHVKFHGERSVSEMQFLDSLYALLGEENF